LSRSCVIRLMIWSFVSLLGVIKSTFLHLCGTSSRAHSQSGNQTPNLRNRINQIINHLRLLNLVLTQHWTEIGHRRHCMQYIQPIDRHLAELSRLDSSSSVTGTFDLPTVASYRPNAAAHLTSVFVQIWPPRAFGHIGTSWFKYAGDTGAMPCSTRYAMSTSLKFTRSGRRS